MSHEYVDQHRSGDHICYISNLDRMKAHYPAWEITRSLEAIVQEILESWDRRLSSGGSPAMVA
jgi:CDP-paratose 2-epimerase